MKDQAVDINVPVKDLQITPGISEIFNDKDPDGLYPLLNGLRDGACQIRIPQGVGDQVKDSFHPDFLIKIVITS
jgi:hypothetical protein